jgi:hypothetical protein
VSGAGQSLAVEHCAPASCLSEEGQAQKESENSQIARRMRAPYTHRNPQQALPSRNSSGGGGNRTRLEGYQGDAGGSIPSAGTSSSVERVLTATQAAAADCRNVVSTPQAAGDEVAEALRQADEAWRHDGDVRALRRRLLAVMTLLDER